MKEQVAKATWIEQVSAQLISTLLISTQKVSLNHPRFKIQNTILFFYFFCLFHSIQLDTLLRLK